MTPNLGLKSALEETLRACAVSKEVFENNSILEKHVQDRKERDRYFPQLRPDYFRETLEATLRQLIEASEFTRNLRWSEQVQDLTRITVPAFDFPAFPGLSIPGALEIDWDATTERHKKAVIRMAECGWTAPDWMGLEDLSNLAEATDEEIEEFFVEGYLGGENNGGMLNLTATALLSSPELARWNGLLEEVFECMQIGKRRVCVISLLTVLEGFLAQFLVGQQIMPAHKTKVADYLKRTQRHEDSTYEAIWWISAVNFLNLLFKDSDFQSDCPSFINRHWILHGRSETEWATADALKLINALSTLHWLCTNVAADEIDSVSGQTVA
jgi:hypothetical protein